MLWVLASLLTLVEDVLSEEDNKEAESDLHSVFRQPSWSPAGELEENRSIHTTWPEVVREYSVFDSIINKIINLEIPQSMSLIYGPNSPQQEKHKLVFII